MGFRCNEQETRIGEEEQHVHHLVHLTPTSNVLGFATKECSNEVMALALGLYAGGFMEGAVGQDRNRARVHSSL